MFSNAVNLLFKIHGEHLTDIIEIINSSTGRHNSLMQRMFIVSLAAFWEAFHEELCRETLARCSNHPSNVMTYIDNFHNPTSFKIDQLYKNVLGINKITESWWGNLKYETGITPSDFRERINQMMNVRHDTAHGKWELPLSASDCMDYISAVMHLALRTDEAVFEHYPSDQS